MRGPHIYLKSIVTARLAEKRSTYLAFLDFRKAFDTVWRDGLLSIAWNIGIRFKVWKIIDSLYDNVLCNVQQLPNTLSTGAKRG